MIVGATSTKRLGTFLGCFVGFFALMHVSYAKVVQKFVRPHPQHAVIEKVIFHGPHPIKRLIHRPVIRRVLARRPDERHGYVHRVLHRPAHPYVHHADYLWCVPYARDISHIDIVGDAFLWWAEAAGRYARGHRPQAGAVLNFRSSPRIPLGHVAVVSRVVSSREILVDQANWIPDRITRNVPVIDVSPRNDWSEVEVSLGDGRYGMVYPTYGFIYDQPAGSRMFNRSQRTEVAEAPPVTKIRLIAPNRTLR